MSWIEENSKLSNFARFCGNVIKLGKVPRHVALIMDGNRRFAKKLGLERHSGHLHGFQKLTEVLEWCLHLNIREVSVYAFSTENFKRTPDEVEYLMNLAREKFSQLLKETERLNDYQVRVRFVGDLTMLPVDVQRMCAQVMLSTRHNERFHFNVFIAYASRVELSTAASLIADGVEAGELQLADIDSSLLDACCWTTNRTNDGDGNCSMQPSANLNLRKRVFSLDAPAIAMDVGAASLRSDEKNDTLYSSSLSSYPDLVVRTSGEIRMSDFLLWQSGFSELVFYDVYWPEFSVWHFYAAVMRYRLHVDSLESTKQVAYESLTKAEPRPNAVSTERRINFLNRLHADNGDWLRHVAQ